MRSKVMNVTQFGWGGVVTSRGDEPAAADEMVWRQGSVRQRIYRRW